MKKVSLSRPLISKNFFMTNTKLKKITFNECDLEVIESPAFDALDLEFFEVSKSELKTIGIQTFKYQVNLKTLDLAENKLRNVSSKVFENLKRLEKLDLRGNLGEVTAEEEDERNANACDCDWSCYLPDFIRYDQNRAPTCFIKELEN